MKRLHLSSRFLSVILTLILCAGMCATAFAAKTSSSETTKTVYGRTYTYYSIMDTDSGRAEAWLWVENTHATPSGYIGVLPKVYNSSGTAIKTGSWSYNSSYLNAASVHTSCVSYSGSSGYYRAGGSVDLYNGDDYNRYTCNKSPNAYLTASATTDTRYQCHTNEYGDTYGSEYFLNQIDIQPDLVAAVGDDGTEGYVWAEELNASPVSSPEEAAAYMAAEHPDRAIPLYEEDGRTVIGTFTISGDFEQ